MKQLRNKSNEKDKENKEDGKKPKKTNNRQMWLTVNRFLSSSLSNIIGTSKDGKRKAKHQYSFSISTKFSAQQTKRKMVLNCSVMTVHFYACSSTCFKNNSRQTMMSFFFLEKIIDMCARCTPLYSYFWGFIISFGQETFEKIYYLTYLFIFAILFDNFFFIILLVNVKCSKGEEIRKRTKWQPEIMKQKRI